MGNFDYFNKKFYLFKIVFFFSNLKKMGVRTQINAVFIFQ